MNLETNLSLQDVHVLAQAIDLAARRGAFAANEMSQVGASYDRVAGFLAEIEKRQAESEDADEGEAEAALEEETNE